MRQLGYARVSTSEQEGALEAQKSRLEAAGCDEMRWDIESGTEDARDGLLEVMAMVKAGGWDELLITRADRLGRHAAYADALIGICEAHGVRIRSLDGGIIETATPTGFLMARLQTSLAEMESRMLSMRIKKQLAVYRLQGRHLRRRIPFGYAKGEGYKLEPHATEWAHGLKIIDELRKRGSFSAVARELPKWCRWTPTSSNLQAWFVNPVLRGHVGHGLVRGSGVGWKQRWEEIFYEQHMPMISELEWNQLAEELKRTKNPFGGANNKVKHSLTGILFCETCDHRLRRVPSKKSSCWWRCRHRLCKGQAAIKEMDIFPFVVRECVAAAERLAAMAAEKPDIDPRITAKLQDLAAMQELAERNPALKDAVKLLEREIRGMERKKQVTPDLERYWQLMEDPEFFDCAKPEEQRAVFHAVIAKVLVGARGIPLRVVPRNF